MFIQFVSIQMCWFLAKAIQAWNVDSVIINFY